MPLLSWKMFSDFIAEKGMTAKDAAIETMKQVYGAVLSSTLVLVAVFAPVAFLGGLSGELYPAVCGNYCCYQFGGVWCSCTEH